MSRFHPDGSGEAWRAVGVSLGPQRLCSGGAVQHQIGLPTPLGSVQTRTTPCWNCFQCPGRVSGLSAILCLLLRVWLRRLLADCVVFPLCPRNDSSLGSIPDGRPLRFVPIGTAPAVS